MAFSRQNKKVLPGWIGFAILQVAQNVILGFQSLAYFCNLLILLVKIPLLSRSHLLQHQILRKNQSKFVATQYQILILYALTLQKRRLLNKKGL